MKILVFSDVHASLNCLQALVETEDYKSADKVIFLGDIVMGCSRPNECIEFVKNMNCICLLGNNDDYICNRVPEVDWVEFDDVKKAQYEYMNGVVSYSNKEFLKTWDREIYMNVFGKTLYFTHYAWRMCDNEFDIEGNPEEICLESRQKMFGSINADYVFFGHEHGLNHFEDESKVYYCLNTIGLEEPGFYLIVNVSEDNVLIEEKYVNYNIQEEIELMDKAGYPYGKDKINTRVNSYNVNKFEVYKDENEEKRTRDFHKSRTAFLIVDGEIKILKESGMSHFEWARSIGINETEFNNIVRGYILDNTMVFYKGDFEYDDEVINASRKYGSVLKKVCSLNGVYKVYCGVIKKEPGEVWPPKLFVEEV